MSELSRKQFLISEENVVKLSSLSAAHAISEGEIVRRAIDAYDPNGAHEKEAEAMLDQMESALKSALNAVDQANAKVVNLLSLLEDNQVNRSVVKDALEEIDQNPGWLDDLADMLKKNSEADAA